MARVSSMGKRRTVINTAFIKNELTWKLRFTLKQLNDYAGFGGNYIYRLVDDSGKYGNINLRTVDRLYNAIIARAAEIERDPTRTADERAAVRSLPLDNLWDKLLIHETIYE